MEIVTTHHDLESSIPNESNIEQLADAAARCALRSFHWRFITLVMFNSSIFSGVERFLALYGKGCIIQNCLFDTSETTRQFVIFGTDIENISRIIYSKRRHVLHNSGKFIVVCQSEIPSDCNEHKAVEIFWSYKITNVVFIKLEERNAVCYTTNHADETCVFTKPVKITCQNSTEKPSSSEFPEKLKNLHKCPLTVSTFIQLPYMMIQNNIPKGADGDLLLLIADRLNASLEVMTPHRGNGWGTLEDDGLWSGSLGDVQDDIANFSITSAAVTLSRFTYFQMSIGYFSTHVIWVTHVAPMKPSSLKLLYPFEFETQILIGTIFVFVALGIWLINSKYFKLKVLSPRLIFYEGFVTSDIILYSWMICMGLPTTKLPTKQAFLICTMSWIWYCYLIRTLYQVYLIHSLQGNFFYDEINTIEDAFYANYSFGGEGALRDYYINEPIIYDNWQVLETNSLIPTLFEVAKGKQFVLATNMENLKTLMKQHNLVVHILSQRIVVCPAVLFYKKFSPLRRSVNKVLARLMESGFVVKAYKDHATNIFRDKSNEHEAIQLQHYAGCYAILLIGWLTSTIVCLGEIFYKKIQMFYGKNN